MKQGPALARRVRSSRRPSSSAKAAEACTWGARTPASSALAVL